MKCPKLSAKIEILDEGFKYLNETYHNKELSLEDKVALYEDVILHVNEFIVEAKLGEVK